MLYDNQQVVNQALAISAKIGGELAKAVLLTTLEKIKETKENKIGLKSLKNLLKSKEELGVVKINKDNLTTFKKKAKSLGIQFASINSKGGNEVKIMYKTRQTNQIKDVLIDLLEKEKANKLDEFQEKTEMFNRNKNNEIANNIDTFQENLTYNQLNKHLDFPGINDGYYRQEIRDTTNEESIKLSESLKEKGIENDIVVTGVNENNNFNILLRVNEKDKYKLKGFMNEKEIKNEKVKESLDRLIYKAENQKQSKIEAIADAKAIKKSKAKEAAR